MNYFVTGTDTDSGKTLISSAILCKRLRTSPKHNTLGLKPIASGCEKTAEGLRNSDALNLISQSSIKLDYQFINPFSFLPAIAPHIAAEQTEIDISPAEVLAQLKLSLQSAELASKDTCLIEGAGGWRLPLGEGKFLSEVVAALDLPVILVVGVKLGCLNHAVLTQESILGDGLKVAGWVANIVEPDTACLEENLASLSALMHAPCLGVVPYLQDASAENAADFLELEHVFFDD
ncbi:dethiobiotin synthase [Shewanella sp. UCD-KL12]|uniref:dethiobiotin synthase n=1 Tax=Shewanella sp. UCD-KL12 TaxID=1917163 RepID=UPI0009705A3B|nr:dethiobiotin synthase [Shewanella sp. UCD-KL12]